MSLTNYDYSLESGTLNIVGNTKADHFVRPTTCKIIFLGTPTWRKLVIAMLPAIVCKFAGKYRCKPEENGSPKPVVAVAVMVAAAAAVVRSGIGAVLAAMVLRAHYFGRG